MLHHNKTPAENASRICGEMRRAAEDNNHPLRLVTLSTISSNGTPGCRLVVLRNIDEKFRILMYTDSRSEKVNELRANPASGLLLWNDENKLQVSLTGKTEIIESGELHREHIKRVKGKSRRSYTTQKAPGAEIGKNFEEPDFYDFEAQNYFTLLRFHPKKMTALHLGSDRHLRLSAKLVNQKWDGVWIVP